ncbi:MAG: hypothetical protein KGO83_06910 [Paenibacillaceae bacterium]|nr:hypothetical protein [Paenibacillaceae bacterium]
MRFRTAKIHTFRRWGLGLTLLGMLIMVSSTAAYVFQVSGASVIAAIGLILGILTMGSSMFVYFWAGMLSTHALHIVCPSCDRVTKLLGRSDRCLYCRTPLSLDPPQPVPNHSSS